MKNSRRTYRSRKLSPMQPPVARLVCIPIGIFVVGLIIVGLAGETPSAQAYTAASAPPAQSTMRQTRPVGYPAIRPHASASGHMPPGATTAPSFAVSDAVAYVTTHPMFKVVAVHGSVTVARAEFMSSRTASNILNGEDTGLPDDATVCYVELHGKVDFAGPGGTVATFSRVYELFDAQTGNLLMVGGLD